MQLKTLFRGTDGDAWLASAQEATYTTWRNASDVAADRYRAWTAAPLSERRLAYEAYVAALDWEEHAARAYQDLVEEGSRAAGAP